MPMTSLNELTKRVLSDLKNGVDDRCTIQNLLNYPLDQSQFNFHLNDKDCNEFYTICLPRIMHELLVSCEDRHNVNILNLLSFCTKYSKADSWLECLINHIKVKKIPVCEIIFTELDRYILKLNRLVSFYTFCLEPALYVTSSTTLILDQRIRMLSRIPSYISNILKGDFKTNLMNNNCFVNSILLSCISLDSNSPNKYKLFGLIISHLGLSGYANEVSDFITKQILKDEITIWSESLKHIKNQSLEICIQPILRKCPNPKALHLLLFTNIESDNPRLCFLLKLFSRLCFVRYFPSGNIIRKIFGAFALCVLELKNADESSNLISLVDDQLGKPALLLWADSCAIQSSSIERRVYISQIVSSWITDFRNPIFSKLSKDIIADHLLSDILSGISAHLSSPRHEIRLIGMVMGEWMMGNFDWSKYSDTKETLKFEYEEVPFINKLRPYFLPLEVDTYMDESKSIIVNCIETEDKCEKQFEYLDLGHTNPNELDSDDDADDNSDEYLKPLPANPIKSELKYSTLKRPHYLRECLDGMMMSKTEDNLINIACTMAAEELIYAHPVAARELAVQFSRVLVHIESPATPNPVEINLARHRALIAVGVVAPIECARYLTNEFCQLDCSIGQRLSIVSAITDIACRLSGLEFTLNESSMDKKPLIVEIEPQKSILSSVLCEPLSSKRDNPKLNAKGANKFAQIAGEFFFPLLQSIPQLCACSIKGGTFSHQDSSVLANLLAALATLFACARFAPVQYRMAEEFIDLIPLLQRHPEPAVRRALLIGVGTVITHMPSPILLAHPKLLFGKKSLGSNGCEIQQNKGSFVMNWLESCSLDETDSECHILAKTGLAALFERYSEFS